MYKWEVRRIREDCALIDRFIFSHLRSLDPLEIPRSSQEMPGLVTSRIWLTVWGRQCFHGCASILLFQVQISGRWGCVCFGRGSCNGKVFEELWILVWNWRPRPAFEISNADTSIICNSSKKKKPSETPAPTQPYPLRIGGQFFLDNFGITSLYLLHNSFALFNRCDQFFNFVSSAL